MRILAYRSGKALELFRFCGVILTVRPLGAADSMREVLAHYKMKIIQMLMKS